MQRNCIWRSIKQIINSVVASAVHIHPYGVQSIQNCLLVVTAKCVLISLKLLLKRSKRKKTAKDNEKIIMATERKRKQPKTLKKKKRVRTTTDTVNGITCCLMTTYTNEDRWKATRWTTDQTKWWEVGK